MGETFSPLNIPAKTFLPEFILVLTQGKKQVTHILFQNPCEAYYLPPAVLWAPVSQDQSLALAPHFSRGVLDLWTLIHPSAGFLCLQASRNTALFQSPAGTLTPSGI